MLDVAEATGDADLLIVGHALVCDCYGWAGELTTVVEHCNKVLDLYDSKKHFHLADILNQDPKTVASTFGSIAVWMLGYPDQALRLSDENDEHAHRRGHPFDLRLPLIMGPHDFDHRYNCEYLRKRAEELEWLGRENSLPMFWAIYAPALQGLALIREGKPADGIVLLKAAMAVSGGANHPNYRAYLAEAMAQTGDLDNALLELDKAIAQIERPGWEERFFYAETLRLKGWVLSLKGDPEG